MLYLPNPYPIRSKRDIFTVQEAAGTASASVAAASLRGFCIFGKKQCNHVL